MSDAVAIRQPTPSSLARRDELTIEDMIAQVQKIQMVMERVMKEGEHYGVIPGTGTKPSLLKPGAEKLCMLFRLAPDPHSVEVYDGKHLTVKSKNILTHIPTGEVWGSGEGSCSTKESKYAYRQSRRACPKCGAEQINKSKFPRRDGSPAGWYCHAKSGGCGAEFAANDPQIMAQETGRRANEDLADQYNTVLKMANKRALVAAVLNVTAASDIFTQDLEDLHENAPRPAVPGVADHAPETSQVGGPAVPTDEAATLFPSPEEQDRNTLISDAQRLAKLLKLSPKDRETFKQTYLGGAEPFDCDLAALADMVNALRARAGEPKVGAAA